MCDLKKKHGLLHVKIIFFVLKNIVLQCLERMWIFQAFFLLWLSAFWLYVWSFCMIKTLKIDLRWLQPHFLISGRRRKLLRRACEEGEIYTDLIYSDRIFPSFCIIYILRL